MTLDELFNNAKTQDAGYEEGHVSHRKNGDFIKQGGSWVPMKGQNQEGAEKSEAGTDEQTMRQSLINFMEQKSKVDPESAKKAVDELSSESIAEAFENMKQQYGDKYTAKQEEPAPEQTTPEYDEWERQQLQKQEERAKNDPTGYGYEEPPQAPAAGPQRDVSAENRAYHERVEKERAERKASAQQSAQTAAQEAKQKGYTGETLKDFMLSKTYEGASVSVTQRGMEAQGWSLTKGEDGLNVYEKPDGSKVTMQLEGNKVKSAEYQPAGSTDKWEVTKNKNYEMKTFNNENEVASYLEQNGYKPEGKSTTSYSSKGPIKEEVYKNGDKTIVKLSGEGVTSPRLRRKIDVGSTAPAKEKTFTFTKAGHVYNVPASSPAEAVQKLKARGVKGFKESDAFDDSTPRSTAGSAEGWASKAFTSSQKKQMEKLGFKANGDSWITERNGHKYEIKVNQQNHPYMSGPATSAELYIDGDKRPYQFGGGETIDPNSMVKIEKALKEQGYNAGTGSTENSATKLKGQKLNEVTTTYGDGSKQVYKITGGENDVANEFFRTHGQRFSFMGPDVNVDKYVKPIDKNSFELKLWNRGNTTKGLYGKLAPSNNNTDDRYIVTKTKDGWEMKQTYRGNYGGTGAFEKSYKLDNNQFSRDEAPLITAQSVNGPREKMERKLTGDCKVKLSKIKK